MDREYTIVGARIPHERIGAGRLLVGESAAKPHGHSVKEEPAHALLDELAGDAGAAGVL
jgi:hypothetical protein